MSLVGLAEIADLLGVTKQVVANWRTRKPNFPQPVASLKSGPVWAEDAIVAWAAAEGLQINRPVSAVFGPAPRGKPAVVAAIMNMKGGVGKSTIAANLGWFAAYNKNLRILLIDLDPQFNLSQYILGVKGYEKLIDEKEQTVEALFRSDGPERPSAELKDLIRVIHNWNDGSCLHLVPADLELARSMKHALERAHVLRDGIQDVEYRYDLVIIDCAPTESILSWASYFAADYIFVPVRPEFLSTIGLPLLLKSIEEFQKSHKNESAPEIGGIVFNDTSEKLEHDRSRSYVKQIAHQYGFPVFANEISHSDSYPAGARAGKPIFMTENARFWKKEEFSRVAEEFFERVGL